MFLNYTGIMPDSQLCDYSETARFSRASGHSEPTKMFNQQPHNSASGVGTTSASATEKENRRIQRISLPLPARVEVRIDSKTTWNEITRLSDVSAFGAGFTLKRPVKRGRLVQMTIPMPRQLRCFDYSEPQYRIYALVRRCISTSKAQSDPSFAVGVAFVGQKPPVDHLEHPSRLYDISHRESENEGFWHVVDADLKADDSDLPKDLRKQTRFFIPESLVLELLDQDGNVIQSEISVTENISLGGAAVFTQYDLEPGAFLRVRSERFDVTIISVVRGKRIGSDGVTRLHLEFIDRLFPLEGIE